MQTEITAEQTARTETERPDLDRVTSYVDGDSVVICDRTNPEAWIRADVTAALES